MYGPINGQYLNTTEWAVYQTQTQDSVAASNAAAIHAWSAANPGVYIASSVYAALATPQDAGSRAVITQGIADLYQAAVGRPPTALELSNGMNELLGGISTTNYSLQISNTPESITFRSAAKYTPHVALVDRTSGTSLSGVGMLIRSGRRVHLRGLGSLGAFNQGDNFTLTITGGKPNAPVTVSLNGGGATQVGTTDGNGNYSTSGTWDASSVGTFTEQWYVGGTPANGISFQVLAAAAALVMSAADAARITTDVFQQYFNRAPNAGDLAYWVDALSTGKQTQASLVQAALNSNEYRTLHPASPYSDSSLLAGLNKITYTTAIPDSQITRVAAGYPISLQQVVNPCNVLAYVLGLGCDRPAYNTTRQGANGLLYYFTGSLWQTAQTYNPVASILDRNNNPGNVFYPGDPLTITVNGGPPNAQVGVSYNGQGIAGAGSSDSNGTFSTSGNFGGPGTYTWVFYIGQSQANTVTAVVVPAPVAINYSPHVTLTDNTTGTSLSGLRGLRRY